LNDILKITDLTVRFDTRSGSADVVDNVSLGCRQGETLAILGESGCGKSVLAGAIMRILDSSAKILGKILLKGLDILALTEREMEKIRGNRMAIIIQNPDSALNPVFSIGNQLAEGLRTHTGMDKRKAMRTILKRLEKMGFKESRALLKMFPHQLSGGMKQRLLITAALLTRPELIIADEPSKGLDPATKKRVVVEMQKQSHQQRSGLLLITHDTQVAREMGNRVAVMYAGEIVEMADSHGFFKNPRHPYSRALLDSSPERGFQPIPGTPPSIHHLPPGCRFHPRCAHRMSQCFSINPEMRQLDKDSVKCHLY
jgi:peptide/nickel transport system ATP-binding protein